MSQTPQTQNYNTLRQTATYADNVFAEFQDHHGNSGARRDVPSQNLNVGSGESRAHRYDSTQPEKSDIP